MVGAMATAATESQATPATIAQAVQRVQDQASARLLTQIRDQLNQVRDRLGALTQINNRLGTINTNLAPPTGLTSDRLGRVVVNVARNVHATCAATTPSFLCPRP